MSYVIRPVEERDFEDVTKLAQEASVGINLSLPRNANLIKIKILTSIDNFASDIKFPTNEFYLFALEELKTRKCIGVSGIQSKNGVNDPLFLYKLEGIWTNRLLPQMIDPLEILRPIKEVNSPTEICTLFLQKEHRKEGLGKKLSFSRLMFMADDLNRFDSTVFANMQGVIQAKDICPFWDALGRKFCNITFLTLMNMIHHNREFISGLIPPLPVYVTLLPDEVQKLIGQTHPSTTPALNLLLREGFSYTQKIDPFDGGPIISSPTQEIHAIKVSQTVKIGAIEEVDAAIEKYLISNRKIEFRCVLASLKLDGKNKVTVSSSTAKALKVEIGDNVRISKVQKSV